MLEIATDDRVDAKGGDWVLRVGGELQGEWVAELRRNWLRLRQHEGGTRIRIELLGVDFVDRAGRLLLAEMREHGVHVTWTDSAQIVPALRRAR